MHSKHLTESLTMMHPELSSQLARALADDLRRPAPQLPSLLVRLRTLAHR